MLCQKVVAVLIGIREFMLFFDIINNIIIIIIIIIILLSLLLLSLLLSLLLLLYTFLEQIYFLFDSELFKNKYCNE